MCGMSSIVYKQSLLIHPAGDSLGKSLLSDSVGIQTYGSISFSWICRLTGDREEKTGLLRPSCPRSQSPPSSPHHPCPHSCTSSARLQCWHPSQPVPNLSSFESLLGQGCDVHETKQHHSREFSVQYGNKYAKREARGLRVGLKKEQFSSACTQEAERAYLHSFG